MTKLGDWSTRGPVFTVEPGRQICRYGRPFVTIRKDTDASPVETDEVAHLLCDQLNKLYKKARRG